MAKIQQIIKYTFLIFSVAVIIFIFYRQYYFAAQLHLQEYMAGLDDNPQTNSTEACSTDFANAKNLPLKECCVKSSFNSAYDGTDVSADTIKQRIQEGYRFIDLNVFSAEGEVYVGYSPDNAPTLISNKLLLSDALKQINDTAFSSTTVFDSHFKDIASYPLFVHIRIYRKPNSNIDIISNVEKIINGSAGSPPAPAPKACQRA
jgi:hypothetical protein